jgi:hypothetical protein
MNFHLYVNVIESRSVTCGVSNATRRDIRQFCHVAKCVAYLPLHYLLTFIILAKYLYVSEPKLLPIRARINVA